MNERDDLSRLLDGELDPVVGVHTGPGTLGVAVAPQPS